MTDPKIRKLVANKSTQLFKKLAENYTVSGICNFEALSLAWIRDK